ncbi:MAG: hypothetical protein WCQ00_01795 [bacterium]
MNEKPIRNPIDWKTYIISFFITALIFASAFGVNSLLNGKKTADIKSVQDQIALDILSSETQFDLLKEASCKNVDDTILSQEINSLATKLSYMEANNTGAENAELVYLKKYYSLLQIKDYILMQRLSVKCDFKPISILYFYGNKDVCPQCVNMGFVLTELRQKYPEVRIYSFDTNLQLSALNTLRSINKISETQLPAVIIGEQAITGFRTYDDLKKLIPELEAIDKTRTDLQKANKSKATTTKSILDKII